MTGTRGGLGKVQSGYTDGIRRFATRSMEGLARSRLSPDVLTWTGLGFTVAGSIVIYFEYRSELLAFWVGAGLVLAGAVLDILDGALARSSGRGTDYGAFLDSTTDRIAEGLVLGAIAIVFARDGNEVAVAATVAAVAGSFLVSYTRAKAEALGVDADVGIGSRAERVFVIIAGLLLAPWGVLPWAIYFLTATAWLTVAQRVIAVRAQLRGR